MVDNTVIMEVRIEVKKNEHSGYAFAGSVVPCTLVLDLPPPFFLFVNGDVACHSGEVHVESVVHPVSHLSLTPQV